MYYVKVAFALSDSAKKYIYEVPNYIDAEDIQKYVVVEDVFWSQHQANPPYTIAVVKEVFYSEKELPWVTSCIAGAIDNESFTDARFSIKHRKYRDEILVSDILDLVYEMSTAEKEEIVDFLSFIANSRD